MKKIAWAGCVLVFILCISGCESFTVRSSPDAFRTGRLLKEGDYRIVTNSILLATTPLPGLIWRASTGLPYDMEATFGWGVHALIVGPEDAEAEDDVYQGPEVFISKNIVDLNGAFYLSATAGTEMNVHPRVDAAFIGGADFGWYPADWFVVFGHTRLLYHTSGYLAPQVGFGLGIDGPFILKIAGYTHLKDELIPMNDATVFWPYYYGLQLGFQF